MTDLLPEYSYVTITELLKGQHPHRREIGFQTLIDQGKDDVPVVCLKFRCTTCGSRLPDCVVSGSRLGPNRSA